jgi:di/tricarboxylate transporter
MMPVVIDIARRTKRPPSKLLMPLAFASLLGGLNTLIGTPPNILISDSLRQFGLQPFRMFDYTPVGVVAMLAGIAFVALIGRHLLPSRDIGRSDNAAQAEFVLQERLFILKLPARSILEGKTLSETRLGRALGINVIAILRGGVVSLAPGAEKVLKGGDRMLVVGRLYHLDELRSRRHLTLESKAPHLDQLSSEKVALAEVRIAGNSKLLGRTLLGSDFRRKYGAIVLAIRREGQAMLRGVDTIRLRAGDDLLIQAPRPVLEELPGISEFEAVRILDPGDLSEDYAFEDWLIGLRVPAKSMLIGKTLAESRIAEVFGLAVLGIRRDGVVELVPNPFVPLEEGDVLLAKGNPHDLVTLRGLEQLEIETHQEPKLDDLDTESIGFAEATLSPRTSIAGKTLRQIQLRERYGLSVLGVWRKGRAYRTDLRDMPLKLGDALLLHGHREKLSIFAKDSDFLMLTEALRQPPRLEKAPWALLVMVAVLLPVILGWLPIAISAVMGVALMVLTGSLTMDEAYRSIEWQAVFLIAGMLPLGIAMEQTGAAQFLAEGVISVTGSGNPLVVLAGLFLLAATASQIMPNAAVAVLLAPIAFNTANDIGVSPYPMLMGVAVAASAAFLSPVGHAVNVLVMGPGGYRFTDYLKVGIPLTLVTLIVTLLVLPQVWPFYPQ